MTDKELIRGLRDVEIRYKDCFYSTGEVRVSDMARDCADRIEQLQTENARLEKQLAAAVELIPHTCKTCGHKHRPQECDINNNCDWKWEEETE